MKRGFLKTTKTMPAGHQPMKVFDHSAPPPVMKMTAGVVENAGKRAYSSTEYVTHSTCSGKPEGYTVSEASIVESDAYTVHDDDNLVMTRQPASANATTECLVSGWVKRQIVETPGFPKSLAVPASGPVHRIAEVPGMGKGMFATRKLSAGDLILDERPLLMSPVAIPVAFDEVPEHFTTEQVKQASLHEQEKLLEILFHRMSDENQQAYMELANSHQHDGSGPILGVLRTNGFGIGTKLRNKGILLFFLFL